MDIMDTMGPHLRVLHVRRANCSGDKEKGVVCSCGLAFQSKMWLQPDKAKRQWRCQLDWVELVGTHERSPEHKEMAKCVEDLPKSTAMM